MISDGQPVNAATDNAAFMSRNSSTTDTVAVVTLNNALAASGPAIANLQQAVNNSSLVVAAPQVILANAQITLDENKGLQILKVEGDGSPVNLNTIPFGASFAGVDGTIIHLIGLNDTNTVTLSHNDATDGVVLNGNATLGRFDQLTLVWDATEDRFIEISRNF